MIFNTIEKQLTNFAEFNKKLTKKCSINYSPVKNTKINIRQNHSEIQTLKQSDHTNVNKYRVRMLSEQKRKPIPKLNQRLTVPVSRLDFQNNRIKSRKLTNSKIKSRPCSKLLNRCHPDNFTQSQKSNINQFTPSSSQNNQSSHCKTSVLKVSDISNKNLLRYKDQKQDQIPRIIRQPYLPINHIQKQHQHQLSRTAVTVGVGLGSQLYQLSPIHFNKYIQYQDQLQQQQKQRKKEGSHLQYADKNKQNIGEITGEFVWDRDHQNIDYNRSQQNRKANEDINKEKLYCYMIQQKVTQQRKTKIQSQILTSTTAQNNPKHSSLSINQTAQSKLQSSSPPSNIVAKSMQIQQKNRNDHELISFSKSDDLVSNDNAKNNNIEVCKKQTNANIINNNAYSFTNVWIGLLMFSILGLLVFQLVK